MIDDGSTDDTETVLQMYERNPAVRIHRQARLGQAEARNAGVHMAKFEFVGFLDADDRWVPDKARIHLDLMSLKPSLDLTYSWWRVIDQYGAARGRYNRTEEKDVDHGLTFEGLLCMNFTGTASTVICRTSAIIEAGGFDPSLKANVDLDLWLRVARLREGNIALVRDVLTDYRIHEQQVTSDWNRMMTNWLLLIEKMRRLEPARVALVESRAIFNETRYLAYVAYERGDYPSARRLVAECARTNIGALLGNRRNLFVTAAAITSLLPPVLHLGLARWARAALSARKGS